MNRNKIIFYVSTGLISILMLLSAGMYFFNHQIAVEMFTNLGYPTYLIYPLGAAKLLGLVAIWTNYSNTLKEWAYAGLFFDLLLAAFAHIHVEDGSQWTPLMALVVLLVSYVFHSKVLGTKKG